MKPGRLPWLLLALVGTAALAAFGGAEEDTVRAATATATTEPLPIIRALAPRLYAPAHDKDPFASSRPEAATPAIPAGEPHAVPSVPSFIASLPWRVLGKQLNEHDGWSVFLARGEETVVVRGGDMLDDTYRVVAITPPTLTLLHLKHKTRRTLDIGDAKE